MATEQKSYRAISVKMPLGLYLKTVELAGKSHLSIHAYVLRSLWISTKWDGKEVINSDQHL